MLAQITAPIAITTARAATLGANDSNTTSPIKHVIIFIGENRTFDHLFATYTPPTGQTVTNLLSEGIITATGAPGGQFGNHVQKQASAAQTYSNSPTITGPYTYLPPPNTGGTPTSPSDTSGPPFATLAVAAEADPGLLPGDLHLLLEGASGLPTDTIDTRIANVKNLPPGPFQLSPGLSYNDYANSPVHRFFQMWQQLDCNVSYAASLNPTGCRADLFPWVEVTVSAGSNGKPQPANFTDESTNEGATAMGFYNVQQGEVPYFTLLAQRYAINDNYHQAVMGGTGANHIMLGSGDAFYYTDGKGNATTPPSNEIENPNPQHGTNNYYTQDGYSGGSYVGCADTSQPGVAPITNYLASLRYKPKPNCEPGHYYLVNNYDPGYYGDGTVATSTDTFSIPPSPVKTIGDTLLAAQISWRYYGEGWNNYVNDPHAASNTYCNICNPFQYETAIMTNEPVRLEHLKDTTDLYNDIADETLPAVSIVKPSGLNDGHPESSKFNIFEAFVNKIVKAVQGNPRVWQSTAIFITTDEAGGYWDSGYIQPLDFFGDGPRIMLIVVSPYTTGGHVLHSYTDHVSILKFIEANWKLPKISARSRDNLPNPTQDPAHPYVPTNQPAIGNLMDMFHF